MSAELGEDPVQVAGPAHARVLAAMHARAFPEDPWDADAFLTLLGQPGGLALIDPRGGFLLLRAVLDEAEIITLGAVERRQGIGLTLLRAGLARLRDAGVRVLHLEVDAANQPARALYERLGFSVCGVRRNYYGNGQDALTMRLETRPDSAENS